MNEFIKKLARNDAERLTLARLIEITHKASQGSPGCSTFLDLRRQELAHWVVLNQPGIRWQLEGGYQQAERKRLVVAPEWLADMDDRIAVLRITTSDPEGIGLGHRDYLGAILNLGLNRDKLGDIVLLDHSAFLFADKELADFISCNLARVKHSSVSGKIIARQEFHFQPQVQKVIDVTVASLRMDAAIAAVFKKSRTEVDHIITSGRAQINHAAVTKGSVQVKVGDLISIQGWGRCRLEEIGATTRKGRHRVRFSI